LETQEHKVSDCHFDAFVLHVEFDVDVVDVVDDVKAEGFAGQADDDVRTLENVFSILQQGNKSLLGTVAPRLRGHRDVESASPEHSLPTGQLLAAVGGGGGGAGGGRGGGRTGGLLHAKLDSQCRCLRIQSIARGVRGIP